MTVLKNELDVQKEEKEDGQKKITYTSRKKKETRFLVRTGFLFFVSLRKCCITAVSFFFFVTSFDLISRRVVVSKP